jgi:hypothetical protein
MLHFSIAVQIGKGQYDRQRKPRYSSRLNSWASGIAPSKPNILFILADDLGYAGVSCYGGRDFTTPNIDRTTARGIRFLKAYADRQGALPQGLR